MKIKDWGPAPPDHPIFKQGPSLVVVPRSSVSTTPTGDQSELEAGLDSLAQRVSPTQLKSEPSTTLPKAETGSAPTSATEALPVKPQGSQESM